MDDQSPICNSTNNHLQLQLHQPTSFHGDLDVESLKPLTPQSDEEEEEDEDEDEHNEDSQNEDADEDKNDDDGGDTKIPLLYQVEPGCTQLSCYASIITFIILVIGVFALLMISPPFTAAQRKEPYLEKMIARVMESSYNGEKFPENFGHPTVSEAPLRQLLPGSIFLKKIIVQD